MQPLLDAHAQPETLFTAALFPAGSWYPHDMERAVDLLDRATAMDPAYYDAHYVKALVLDDLARPDAASAAFDACVALRPYDPQLLRTVGCHRAVHGDSTGSKVLFQQAATLLTGRSLAADSHSWEDHRDLGTVLVLLGEREQGLHMMDRAFANAPTRPARDHVDHLRALPADLLVHALLPDRSAVVQHYQQR